MRQLIARARGLLFAPAVEWVRIEAEAPRAIKVVAGHVAPLALLSALSSLIGLAVVGVRSGTDVYRVPLELAAASAAVFVALAIVGVFVFAFIVARLAPMFGGKPDMARSVRLAGYSATPGLLAGVLAIVPALGVFVLVGAAYSLYLLFIGAPILMRPEPRGAVNLSILSLASAIVLGLGVGLAAMAVASEEDGLFAQSGRLKLTSFLPLAPVAAVDGSPDALVRADDLRAIAPRRLAGLERVSTEVDTSTTMGVRAVVMEAAYRKGDRRMSLTIVHSPSIEQVIGFGGADTDEYDRTQSDGYSRRRREGDTIIVEQWNAKQETGAYGRLLPGHFYVYATGEGVSADELREAVRTFTADRLRSLPRGS